MDLEPPTPASPRRRTKRVTVSSEVANSSLDDAASLLQSVIDNLPRTVPRTPAKQPQALSEHANGSAGKDVSPQQCGSAMYKGYIDVDDDVNRVEIVSPIPGRGTKRSAEEELSSNDTETKPARAAARTRHARGKAAIA